MRDAGATHLLHTSPMYNKPPQRGIVAHYRAIAEAVDLPIVVYNVPGRTGSNIEAKTTLELAEIRDIVAVKEASGNLAQIADIIRGRPAEFSVLSGDDELTLPVMALGGDGIISVVSNVAPRLMAELCNAMRAGDVDGAREIHCRLLPWMRAAFIESNPIPVKAALAMMGTLENVLRLPLVPLTDAHDDAGARGAARRRGAVSDVDGDRARADASIADCAPRYARRRRRCPTTPSASSTRCSTRSSAATVRAAERGRRRRLARGAVGEARNPARLSRRALVDMSVGTDDAVLRFVDKDTYPAARFDVERRRAHRARRLVGSSRRVSRAGRRLHAADVRQRRRVRRHAAR